VGYIPIIPPRNAHQALAYSERRLARELRGRRSRWAWKRRRAYQACLTLIRMREAIVGYTADPWIVRAPAKPSDAAASVKPSAPPLDASNRVTR
jgi:hypothetical protein